MLNSGVVVLNVIRKPKPHIWERVKQLVIGRRCVSCGRVEGKETNDKTFIGPPSNGNCPRCNAEHLRQIEILGDKAAGYIDELVRDGEHVPRKLLAEIRREVKAEARAEARDEAIREVSR